MTLLIIGFLVIALAALGMALGAIAGRRPITSGCARLGGLLDGPAECGACGKACDVRLEEASRR